MKVVSDSSPLILLTRMNQAELLASLFGEIYIPHEVWRELQANPDRADAKLLRSSEWLRVIDAPAIELPARGAGERAAIALAKDLPADLLLVDDRQARRSAQSLEIRIAGTASVLELGFRAGHIRDLPRALHELRLVGGWVSQAVIKAVTDRASNC